MQQKWGGGIGSRIMKYILSKFKLLIIYILGSVGDTVEKKQTKAVLLEMGHYNVYLGTVEFQKRKLPIFGICEAHSEHSQDNNRSLSTYHSANTQ